MQYGARINFVGVQDNDNVKSPTSDKTWPNNVFISGDNPYLTSWFCGVVLGSITISNMVSELVPKPIRAPSPKSAGREGDVLGKTQIPHRI